MNQSEYHGRRCWAFCAIKPRTFFQIQRHLGVGESMTRQAIEWCRKQYDTTENPFLMNQLGWQYLYAPRDTFAEVKINLARELRYNRTRLQSTVNVLDQVLATNATLMLDMSRVDRKLTQQIRAQIAGTVAAVEMVLSRI